MSDQQLHVNPWRFRAWSQRGLSLGAFNGRTLPYSPVLNAFRIPNAVVEPRAVQAAGLTWLVEENFLTPEALPIDHPYAPQLGFFSLWGGSPEARLERLRVASVGLLGVGSLGSQVAHLLVAAGVGRLVLCDRDEVEIRNLNRQFYDMGDLGRPKVEAAAERLRRLRPELEVDAVRREVTTAREMEDAMRGVDFLVRALDTPILAPFEVDRAARRLGVPHLGGGFLEAWAAVGPFIRPYGACFRCFSAPPDIQVPDDRKVPTFGPLTFWLSAMVGGEVLRHLAGLGESLLVERMVMMNWATGELRDQRLRPLPGRCPSCGAINGTQPAATERAADAIAAVRARQQTEEKPASADRALDDAGAPHRSGAEARDRAQGDGQRGGPAGRTGDKAAAEPLIGAAAALVGLAAVLASLLLLPAPIPVRWLAILGGEILAGWLGAVTRRPISVANGYLWGAVWAFGAAIVAAVQVAVASPAVMARPLSGAAAVLIAVPVDVLLLSSVGLLAAWSAARADARDLAPPQ